MMNDKTQSQKGIDNKRNIILLKSIDFAQENGAL